MNKTQSDTAKTFYDSVSVRYDTELKNGYLTTRIRTYVQNELAENFDRGSKLLDMGCGTGTDATFLAKKGLLITAIDPSVKMLELAKQKASAAGMEGNIQFLRIGGEEILTLDIHNFDGAYSNFNAVNHIENIEKFSEDLAAVLSPKAKVFMVMLNRSCPFESFLYLLKLKPVIALKKMFRRESTFSVKLKLYFPGKIKKMFSDNFRTVSVKGFGIFTPTDSFSSIYQKFGRLFDFLVSAENQLSSLFPFYNFCDHYLIELERK